MLLSQFVADAFEPRAPVAFGTVGDRRPQHAERNLLTVDGRLQLRLEHRRLLLVAARQRAEVALAGEARKLGRAEASVHRGLHAPRLVEARDVFVLPVDRFQVEVVLQPGEVVVVLLVEIRDEAVDTLPVRIQLTWSRFGHRAVSRRIENVIV